MTDTQVTAPALRTVPDQRSVDAPPVTPPRRFSVASTALIALPPAALTLIISMFGIGKRGLWNDEYATWDASTRSFGDLLKLLDNVDAVVAPFYVFMHGWIALSGDITTSMRVPSAVALACTAGLIALIGRRLFDPSVGFTAGLLFAGIPMVSRYSQEARPYAFAIAGATLATLLLLRATEDPSWRRWGFYGGCLVFAGLMHIVTLTVLVAHAVLIWRVFRAGHDFRLLRWIAAVAAAIACALPLVTKGFGQTGAIAWIKADGSAIRQMPEKIFGSPPVAFTIIVLALITVAALWKTDRRAMGLLVPWAVFPPLFCYLTFPLLHLFLHRYLLFTVPAWTLLAAALGYAVARHVRDREPSLPLSLGALLIVAAVFFVGEPGQVAARRDPVLDEPDFHGAAVVVQEQAQKGDGIVYAGTTRNARRAFAYEDKHGVLDTPRDILLGRSDEDAGTFGAEECADPVGCVGDTSRIWLVSATDIESDPFSGLSYDAKALLDVEFDAVEVAQLENVRVLLLTRTTNQ